MVIIRMKNPVVCGFLILLLSFPVWANTHSVENVKELKQALKQASSGDHILLAKGIYPGNFVIEHSLTLHCEDGATLDGQHQNDTLRIKAPHVTIQHCRIQNWGDDLTAMNAGIFAENNAHHVFIEKNQFQGDTFGIWLDKVEHARVYRNRIQSNTCRSNQGQLTRYR